MKTLATSATIQGLESLISEYFYNSIYYCAENGVIIGQDDTILPGFLWFKRGKRYVFATKNP